jgi:tRNA dimethylallyltransferase
VTRAAEFVRDATRLIQDIGARGKLPLLVGGTMLYFKALFDGLDDMPAADPVIRAQLELEAAAIGWPAMHAELAQVDPVTAARLAPLDSQRIQRALEVYRISGLPLSHFHSTKDATNTVAAHAYSTGARALISLEPSERSWLHQRIAQRFDAMLAQGFVDEVRSLRTRGDLYADLPSMRCVGYRQAWEALDLYEASGSKGTLALAELRERGIIATRQLAKRQITWLRSMPQRQVVQADGADALGDVLDLVRKGLGGVGDV